MIGNLVQFTVLHVVLSIVGIVAGLVVAGGLLAGRRFDGWVATFLATTALTNLTGFGFPIVKVLPSHIVGGISLVILPLVAFALYGRRVAGAWRGVFVVGGVTALYLNVFVLVTQLFAKVPAMIAAAPTQKEPAFVATHVLLLMIFVLLGRAANRGYAAA
jgi:hypothetical protein